VTVDGKKMGKSIGNTSNVFDLVRTYSPMALRFFIVQSHYRSQLEFDIEAIAAAGAGYERLRGTISRLRESIGEETGAGELLQSGTGSAESDEILARFTEAMNDDFNTPVAIGHLFEGVSRANVLLNTDAADRDLLAGFYRLFGFAFGTILGMEFPPATESDGLTPALMELVLELREQARERKDYATADAIRDGLKEAGVVLEDQKGKTRWVLQSQN